MERMDELGLKYRCEYCLAGVGVWCRTRIGARATSLHTNRTDPLMLAYAEGYQHASKSSTPYVTVSGTGLGNTANTA